MPYVIFNTVTKYDKIYYFSAQYFNHIRSKGIMTFMRICYDVIIEIK